MPHLVPWFVRFLAASRHAKLCAMKAALGARPLEETRALRAETGPSDQISDAGCLSLYTDEAQVPADRDHIALLERFGVPPEVIGRQAINALEPEISDDIGLAVPFPKNRSMKDPFRLVLALAARFQSLGGQIERAEVAGFTRSGRITSVTLKDGRMRPADEVVFAAGAFSGRLPSVLDEPIPLETERGYHTQIMAPGILMRHSIIWPARAVMVTLTAGGIRVGGTVEVVGLDVPPDYRHARVTVRRARAALTRFQVAETREWMGQRPVLPDTVPIMSASARTPGLYYATGHGHLGRTQAATTARLMGELITGARPRWTWPPIASPGSEARHVGTHT